MSLFFDNATELIAELRQLLEQTVTHLGRISENTERDVVREQRVTVRAQAVYDAAGNAEVEIPTPLGTSLEITRLSGSVLSGFSPGIYLNAVALPNLIHRYAGGAIINVNDGSFYINDGEKLIVAFEGGTPGEAVYVTVQGKRFVERVGG